MWLQLIPTVTHITLTLCTLVSLIICGNTAKPPPADNVSKKVIRDEEKESQSQSEKSISFRSSRKEDIGKQEKCTSEKTNKALRAMDSIKIRKSKEGGMKLGNAKSAIQETESASSRIIHVPEVEENDQEPLSSRLVPESHRKAKAAAASENSKRVSFKNIPVSRKKPNQAKAQKKMTKYVRFVKEDPMESSRRELRAPKSPAKSMEKSEKSEKSQKSEKSDNSEKNTSPN